MCDITNLVFRIRRELEPPKVEEWSVPLTNEELHGYRFTFANGWQADITDTGQGKHQGLLETAVMKDNIVRYDTPIAKNVIGWQPEDAAFETAKMVSGL